jgi:hypothetical protein
MGNLVEIKPIHLVNEMSAADFGVYTDSVTGQKVLFLKKFGYSLFKTSDSGFVKSTAHSGKLKVSYYELNTYEPADITAYTFGITVDPIRKNPGFNSVPYVSAKTYAATKAISVSDGLITVTSQKLIVDEIVNQVFSDTKAVVMAGRSVLLEDWNTLSAITVNGVAVAAAATIVLFIANINALGVGTAYLVGTDSILIISDGGWLVVANTAGDIIISTKVLLGVVALDVETSFNVMFYNPPITAETIQPSVFPFLTNDEVKQIFANYGNHGDFQAISGVDTVINGSIYQRYTITTTKTNYASIGAGQEDTHRKTIILYVSAAAVAATPFKDADWNNDAPVTHTKTFDQLLDYWIA